MTLVLIWKSLLFAGWHAKTEVIWVLVLGIFIDIHTSIHTYPPYIYDVERWYQHCKPCWRPNIFVNPFIAPQKSSLLQEIYSRGTGRCRIASSKAPIPGTLVHDNCHGEDWDRRCGTEDEGSFSACLEKVLHPENSNFMGGMLFWQEMGRHIIYPPAVSRGMKIATGGWLRYHPFLFLGCQKDYV